MTDLEQVRINIDDYTQKDIVYETGTGVSEVYQMNHKNIYNVTVFQTIVVNDEDVTTQIAAINIEVNSKAGEVIVNAPDEARLQFKYSFSAFTDAEITDLLDTEETINKTTLRCINLLLMSAAKRFDYKSGQKDMKSSQVFDHLKELKTYYENAVESDSDSSSARVMTRTNKHYTEDSDDGADLSRDDL